MWGTNCRTNNGSTGLLRRLFALSPAYWECRGFRPRSIMLGWTGQSYRGKRSFHQRLRLTASPPPLCFSLRFCGFLFLFPHCFPLLLCFLFRSVAIGRVLAACAPLVQPFGLVSYFIFPLTVVVWMNGFAFPIFGASFVIRLSHICCQLHHPGTCPC